jgi:hypothetical protein
VSTFKPAIPDENQLVKENGERLLFAWTKSQIPECRGCRLFVFPRGWTSTAQLEGTWVWRIYSNAFAVKT